MNLNEVFPSKYIKADDLKGREVPVTISSAAMEVLGNDQKLILYFQGKEKGMVCNKTNAGRIAYLYGDDTDDWIGKAIILCSEFVEFQGKTVKGLRVKPPKEEGAAITAPNPKSPNITTATRKVGGISDTQLPEDEVPF
jgi:hypothetical protein